MQVVSNIVGEWYIIIDTGSKNRQYRMVMTVCCIRGYHGHDIIIDIQGQVAAVLAMIP